jgi:ABC-2 type transport system ATP-binding protein
MADNAACPPILLRAEGVTAGYGNIIALQDAGLLVRAGDWVGLLGANGSGKSTFLRALTGQIPLRAGNVEIAGVDLRRWPERAKTGFGYAVDPAELPQGLTGRQYLELVASIRHCGKQDWPHPDLLSLLRLGDWIDQPIAACSLGTRGKISLAGALLGAPPLIILDEALNGLDPIISIRIRRLLAGLVASHRHAVILSTHMLEQIGGVCTNVVFLDAGAITRIWTQDELRVACAAPGGFEAALLETFDRTDR